MAGWLHSFQFTCWHIRDVIPTNKEKGKTTEREKETDKTYERPSVHPCISQYHHVQTSSSSSCSVLLLFVALLKFVLLCSIKTKQIAKAQTIQPIQSLTTAITAITNHTNHINTMQISIALLAFASTASAFAPSSTRPSFGISTASSITSSASASASAPSMLVLAAGGDDDEEGGFDLNLEEMFDM